MEAIPKTPEIITISEDLEDEHVDDQVDQWAEETKRYGCRFCNKTFETSQALGGHQNAHRNEIGKEKQKKSFPSTGRLNLEEYMCARQNVDFLLRNARSPQPYLPYFVDYQQPNYNYNNMMDFQHAGKRLRVGHGGCPSSNNTRVDVGDAIRYLPSGDRFKNHVQEEEVLDLDLKL